MPETSELQDTVLSIVTEHAKAGGLFGNRECFLTNQQIFDLIKPESMRPSEHGYISTVLKKLAVKKKVSVKTKSVVGWRGLKRVITIL